MVRTRSRATSASHQESRDASSNPNRDHQLAPVTQPPSIQHIQSMATAMAELTRQNQELTREIGLKRQHHERHAEEQAQSQENRKENAESKNQSRGIASRRVMHEIRENMKRANPVEDLVHQTNFPFTASINGHPLPPKFKMPSLDSYDGTRDPCDHITTFKTTMHL